MIVTDLMPERVTYENGILVDRDDTSKVKEAIETIIFNPLLRNKMSNNSILFVENELSWKRHVEQFIK